MRLISFDNWKMFAFKINLWKLRLGIHEETIMSIEKMTNLKRKLQTIELVLIIITFYIAIDADD